MLLLLFTASGCSATTSNRLVDHIKVAESQDEEEEEEGEEKDREFAESLSSLGREQTLLSVCVSLLVLQI